jgi:A/G-specific adenine glycosylase
MENPLSYTLPEISHRLLAWFFTHRRELAWREESDPYRIWVSEVMLQQTRAETVSAYYPRFLERFPDVAALARAGEQEVLKAWEGLGYYGRARNLHRAAREVMERHGGRLPDDPEAFRALPGVGPYTAAAVLSIAFARACGVVDGNVTRVVTRLLADPGDPATAALRRRVREFVEVSFCRYHPGWVNQAWMELGALVCRPAPDCPACPLGFVCRAFREKRTAELPARRTAAPLPVRAGRAFLLVPSDADPALRAALAAAMAADLAALGPLLRSAGAPLLLARRPPRGLLGGLWEFPNAVEAEEAAFRAAYGIECLGPAGPEVRHAYSHFRAHLRPVAGALSHDSRLDSWEEQSWVPVAELVRYPRPRLHIKIMRLLGLADGG